MRYGCATAHTKPPTMVRGPSKLDRERAPRASRDAPAAPPPSGCWSRSRSSPVPPAESLASACLRKALGAHSGETVVHHRLVRLRIVGVVAGAAAAAAVAVVALASTSEAGLPSYTEGYRSVATHQREAVHAVRPALCALRREERLREQEEGGCEVPERHRDRQDHRRIRRPPLTSEPGRGDAEGERSLAVRRVRPLGIAIHRSRAGATVPELPRAGARERLRLHEAVTGRARRARRRAAACDGRS